MAEAQPSALEAELTEICRSGDHPEALRRLVEGYGSGILGYLAHTMRDEEDAAEVFSMFCEDLCRGIAGFQGRSTFKTWAYRLATHARARFWSDAYRRLGARLPSEQAAALEQQVRSGTKPYLRTDFKDRFARLRQHLDPDEQSLLTLRLDRDLSWPEIAEILDGAGEPPSEKELQTRAAAWRQRFKRLKDKIRKLADQEGLLDAD